MAALNKYIFLGPVQMPLHSCAELWSDIGATADSNGVPCVEPNMYFIYGGGIIHLYKNVVLSTELIM